MILVDSKRTVDWQRKGYDEFGETTNLSSEHIRRLPKFVVLFPSKSRCWFVSLMSLAATVISG